MKVEDKKAETIIEAFERAFKGILEEYLRTITVDNGKEFAGFKEVEKELSSKYISVLHIHHGKKGVMRILMEY